MDSTILFQNEVMNGILIDISSTKAIAKEWIFQKTVTGLQSLTNLVIQMDLTSDLTMVSSLFCVPDINDNTNEVLLSSSMLPYEAGRFVMIFSILEKDNTFIVKLRVKGPTET